jgi:hypothetical protein
LFLMPVLYILRPRATRDHRYCYRARNRDLRYAIARCVVRAVACWVMCLQPVSRSAVPRHDAGAYDAWYAISLRYIATDSAAHVTALTLGAQRSAAHVGATGVCPPRVSPVLRDVDILSCASAR